MRKLTLGCYATLVTIAMAAYLLVRRSRLSAGPLRMSWSSIVFGHRGCRNVLGIPENTLEAFKYAIHHGCGGIECDVRLTKDGEVVVFHDNYVHGKLAGVPEKKRVDELELAELKTLRYVDDPTGEIRVPTLEEVVLFCREQNTKILIEVKDLRNVRKCVHKILSLYHRFPEYMYEQTTIISFNPKVLYYARRKDPKVATGSIYQRDFIHDCIYSNEDSVPFYLYLCPVFFDKLLFIFQEWIVPWFLGCSLMCPHYSLYNEAYHQKWKSNGIAMYLWGFQDNTAYTSRYKQPGMFISADDKHEEFR